MTFGALVLAGLLLLGQARPDLAQEATMVHILQANPDSPYIGFFDLAHPENVWVNPENAYNPDLMRAALAHELTHHHDWRVGLLTEQTCGEDYVQAELRAFKAASAWQPWQDEVMANYVRGNYQKPCAA